MKDIIRIIEVIFDSKKNFGKILVIMGLGIFIASLAQIIKPGYTDLDFSITNNLEVITTLAYSMLVVFPLAFYLGRYSVKYYQMKSKDDA